MPGPIQDANTVLLNQNSGTVPNVSDALQGWMQPITFKFVTKVIENFQVVETATTINFRGVWQPFTDQELKMKPEGQRTWKWFWVHSETNLLLSPDDVVTYLGTQYRVMSVRDYGLYGYYSYVLIEDYTGAGPS